MIVGYKLIEDKTGNVIAEWGGVYGATPDAPNPIRLPNGDLVAGAKAGDKFHGYTLTAWEMEEPEYVPTKEQVDEERDRRISSGFSFNDKKFQSRSEDRENINGAGSLATIAVMQGAQPGDLRWHGGDTDFVWIADDNSLVPMDAYTVLEFGKQAAQWKSQHIFAARALKDAEEIPADFKDQKYWPIAQFSEWKP